MIINDYVLWLAQRDLQIKQLYHGALNGFQGPKTALRSGTLRSERCGAEIAPSVRAQIMHTGITGWHI